MDKEAAHEWSRNEVGKWKETGQRGDPRSTRPNEAADPGGRQPSHPCLLWSLAIPKLASKPRTRKHPSAHTHALLTNSAAAAASEPSDLRQPERGGWTKPSRTKKRRREPRNLWGPPATRCVLQLPIRNIVARYREILCQPNRSRVLHEKQGRNRVFSARTSPVQPPSHLRRRNRDETRSKFRHSRQFPMQKVDV